MLSRVHKHPFCCRGGAVSLPRCAIKDYAMESRLVRLLDVRRVRLQKLAVITAKEYRSMVQAVRVLVISADNEVTAWVRQALAELPEVELRIAPTVNEANETGCVTLIDQRLLDEQTAPRLRSPWMMLRTAAGQEPHGGNAVDAGDTLGLDAKGADRLVQHIRNAVSRTLLPDTDRAANGGLDANMIETLFSQFAHDFRGPLNSLTMWSSLLRSDETLPKSVAAALDAFAASIATQTELVEELLDFGRILSGSESRVQQEWNDWPLLVASVRQQLMLFAVRKAINLDAVAGRVKQVFADRGRLERIVSTLLLHCIHKCVAGSVVSLIDRLEDGQFTFEIVSSKVNSPLATASIPSMSVGSDKAVKPNRRSVRDRRLVLAEQLISQLGGSLTEKLVAEEGQYQLFVRLPSPQNDE